MKDGWGGAFYYHLACILEKKKGLFSPLLKSLSEIYRVYLSLRPSPSETLSLPLKVISVGNLTWGGTGKTPFVKYLAERLGEEKKVGIITTGFGGLKRMGIFSNGKKVFSSWQEGGDETHLLAENLPGIPVAFGRDRYALSLMLYRLWNLEVVVLDDAFQYRKIKKDVEFLLLDARRPLGEGRLIPYGNLRETWQAIGRADAVILTKCNSPYIDEETIEFLKKAFPSLPFLRVYHHPLFFEGSQGRYPSSWIGGREIVTLSSIGDPVYFEETLKIMGGEIIHSLRFPDHYPYQEEELEILLGAVSREGISIITTEKDYLRIPPSVWDKFPLYYLKVDLSFLEGEEILWEILKEKGIF